MQLLKPVIEGSNRSEMDLHTVAEGRIRGDSPWPLHLVANNSNLAGPVPGHLMEPRIREHQVGQRVQRVFLGRSSSEFRNWG